MTADFCSILEDGRWIHLVSSLKYQKSIIKKAISVISTVRFKISKLRNFSSLLVLTNSSNENCEKAYQIPPKRLYQLFLCIFSANWKLSDSIFTCFLALSIIFIFILNLQLLIIEWMFSLCWSTSIWSPALYSPSTSILSLAWSEGSFSCSLSRKKHLHNNSRDIDHSGIHSRKWMFKNVDLPNSKQS